MDIKTVIFDLDGTLLDTLEDLNDSVNHVLQEMNYPQVTLAQTRKAVGNGLKMTMVRTLPTGVSEDVIEDAFKRMVSYYTDHCQIKTKPYDGVLDLMKELDKRGCKMAIVSNKNDVAVKQLRDLYFSKYIHVAIGECEGIRKKPAPDTVFQAIKELESELDAAIYVGDSEVDFATAKNSGIPCISVTWGFRDKDLLEGLGPAYMVDSPEEILDILK